MADNVQYQSSTPATPPATTLVSTEEVTTLNGASVTAQHVQRAAVALRTADATAIDLPGDATNGLDVDVTRVSGTVQALGTVQAHGTTEAMGTFQPLPGSAHLASALPGTSHITGTIQSLAGSVHVANVVFGTFQAHGTTQVLGTIQPLAGSVHPAAFFFGSAQGWVAHDSPAAGAPLLMGGFGSSGTQAAVGDGDAVRQAMDLNGRAWVNVFSQGTIPGGTVQTHGTSQVLGTVQGLAGSVHLASPLPGTAQVLGTIQPLAGSAHIANAISGTVVAYPGTTAAGTFLTVRLTDGANFYTASGGGGGSGASATDEAVFQEGVTTVAPIAGISTISAIGQGSVGALAMDTSRVLYVRGTLDGGTVQTHGTSQVLGSVQPLAGSVHLASFLPGGTVQTHGTSQALGTVQPLAGSIHPAAFFFGSVQGWAAHDAAAAGAPVLLGAFGSSGTQGAVGDGDATRLWTDLNGRLQIRGTIDSLPNVTVASMPTTTVTGTVQTHGTSQALGTFQSLAGSVHVANTAAVLGSVSAQGYVAHDGVAAGNPLMMGGFGSSGTQAAVADGDVARIALDLNGRQWVNVFGFGTVGGGTVQTHGTSQALGTVQTHGTSQVLGSVQTVGTSQVLGSVQPVGTVQALGSIRVLPPTGTALGEQFFSTILTAAVNDTTMIAAPGAGTFIRIYDILVSGSAAGTFRLMDNAAGTHIGHLHLAANGGWNFNSSRGVRSRAAARAVIANCTSGTWGLMINYALET